VRAAQRCGLASLVAGAAAAIWSLCGTGRVFGSNPTIQWRTFERASVSVSGTPTDAVSPNGDSTLGSISADGQFVVFHSDATDLVTPNTDQGRTNVYLRDLKNQTTTLVSHDFSVVTADGNGDSSDAHISADGSWVSFTSAASNLISSDNNGQPDIFVYNVSNRSVVRVIGLNQPQVYPAGQSNGSVISGDGRFVFSNTCDPNYSMISGCGVLLHDRDVDDSGTYDTSGNTSDTAVPSLESGTCAAADLQLSANGRWLVFLDVRDDPTMSCNATSNATTGEVDVFAWDRTSGSATGVVRVSVNSSGQDETGAGLEPPYPARVDGSGQFVSWSSQAGNLVTGDTNGNVDGFLFNRDVSNSGTLDTPGNIMPSLVTEDSSGNEFTGAPDYALDVDDAGGLVALFLTTDALGGQGPYVREMNAQTTLPVAIRTSDSTQISVALDDMRISGDGSTIVYGAENGDLLGDAGDYHEIFVAQVLALPTLTATPTASATATATASLTASTTGTPTATATATPTVRPTPTATTKPTATRSAKPTATSTGTATATTTATASPTATITATASATTTAGPTATATATASASTSATLTATITPTATSAGTMTVIATATPTPVAGKLTVSPKSINFGTVTVNMSKLKTVKVTNAGKVKKNSAPLPILIEMETVAGTPTPSPFSVNTQCTDDDLQPGGKAVPKNETSCEVSVQFEPTQAVSYSGTLTIIDNLEPSGMQTVKLSGRGKAAK